MLQESFSTLWDGYESNNAALTARNARLRELRKAGVRCHGFTLTNQLRKYEGFGQPDGRSCNVYYVSRDDDAADLDAMESLICGPTDADRLASLRP